jgi:capsular polysaccharide export protein
MAIAVRAPHCRDQLMLVRRCSASLPEGFSLYVKEHPHDLGGLPAATLRALARMPKVVLVPPALSSHELIQASALVLTINSTVGLEALMFGTPVLTLARTFHNGPGLSTHVEDLARLPERVREALQRPVDQAAVRRLVAAMLRATYPGETFSSLDTRANAEDAARAILARTGLGGRLRVRPLASLSHRTVS